MSAIKKRIKEYLQSNQMSIKESDITIVLGNEGMDLDSFVSSLIVGFAEKYIHVVNMKKEIFLAKGDIVYFLKEFNIDPDDLIYLERPLGEMKKEVRQVGSYFLVNTEVVPFRQKQIKLCLTDHNEQVNELQNYEIVTIIDHHRLEHTVADAKRIYIDIDVGSATTLVAKYLGEDLSKKHHCKDDPSNKDPEKDNLCVSIAKMLLIPILIDTKFLKRRTSIFDHIEYKRLKKKASVKKKDLKILLKKIKKERRNDHKLPTEIILQKDFKQFEIENITFGMSTIKYKFEDWIEREGKGIKGIDPEKIGIALHLELDEFRKKAGLDFLLVGCKMNKKRHFIVTNFPWIDMFAKQKQLKKIEFRGLDFYAAPVEMSRKIIAPEIKKFIRDIKLGN